MSSIANNLAAMYVHAQIVAKLTISHLVQWAKL